MTTGLLFSRQLFIFQIVIWWIIDKWLKWLKWEMKTGWWTVSPPPLHPIAFKSTRFYIIWHNFLLFPSPPLNLYHPYWPFPNFFENMKWVTSSRLLHLLPHAWKIFFYMYTRFAVNLFEPLVKIYIFYICILWSFILN